MKIEILHNRRIVEKAENGRTNKRAWDYEITNKDNAVYLTLYTMRGHIAGEVCLADKWRVKEVVINLIEEAGGGPTSDFWK